MTVTLITGANKGIEYAAEFPGGRPVADSAEIVVRVATMGADGPTGTFQKDGGEFGW
jgi:hypothetical protein